MKLSYFSTLIMKAGLLEKGKTMSKTITLSISKDGIARGCGRATGLALDFGLGAIEGTALVLLYAALMATPYGRIAKMAMALCEGMAFGYGVTKINNYVFDHQVELEGYVSELVGSLIGADEFVEEKDKEEEFEKEHCPFSVIG